MQREREAPITSGPLRPATAKQERAYTDAVHRHYARIYAFLYHLTQDVAMAEDLTQETYAAAWRSLHQYEGRGSAYLWLHRIALNVYRQRRRSQQPDPSPLEDEHCITPDPASDVVDRLDAEELSRRAGEAVALLPDEYREMVVLRCFQGLKYREVAELLGVPIGTVQARVHFALQRLRVMLSEEVGPYETDFVHDGPSI